jgi:hypothetical protein
LTKKIPVNLAGLRVVDFALGWHGKKSLAKSILTNSSSLVGSMRIGKNIVFAETDGGLQIMIPAKDEEGKETDDPMRYERTYYELALEASKSCLVSNDSPSDSARFERLKTSQKSRNKLELEMIQRHM